MVYADYSFYSGTYKGTMGEADYTRLSIGASGYIDSQTGGRISSLWSSMSAETQTAVKNACCALSDEMLKQESGGEVAGESNDGVSVTYVASGRSADRRLFNIASMYLSSSGLMFCGV